MEKCERVVCPGRYGRMAKIGGGHFNGGWSAPWLGYTHRAGKGLGLKREGAVDTCRGVTSRRDMESLDTGVCEAVQGKVVRAW